MELTLVVEPRGWGRLRLVDVDRQVMVTVRVSYVSDVLADVIDAIDQAAGGAEAAEARLGLEPGEAVLRMLVTGGPPVRGGGGMPHLIITSSRPSPSSVLRITGAG